MRNVRFGAAGLLLLLAGCGSTSTATPATTGLLPIRESATPAADVAIVYVAYDQGFFKRNGLDLTLTERPGGGLGPTALVNGDTDVVEISLFDVANLRNQGRNTMAVYELQRRGSSDMLVSNAVLASRGLSRDQPIADRLKALKGLRFGVTAPGAPSDVNIRNLLTIAGFDPEHDAQIIHLGSFAGLVAGVSSNQIDAFLSVPPNAQQAAQKGLGKIFISLSAGDVPELRNFYNEVLVMRSDFVAKNPETVRRYVKAMKEAYAFMLDHRDASVASLQKRLPNIDPAAVALGYDALFDVVSATGRFDPKVVKSTVETFHRVGVLDKVPSTDEGVMWTNKYNSN